MRETKFRFYNKRLHKMSKVYGIGLVWENLSSEWGIFDWEDVEKLQFTGLHDRNGKEIYGDDIVKQIFLDEIIVIGVVEYHPPEWRIKDPISGLSFPLTGTFDTIIGSIHTNPEPLKED